MRPILEQILVATALLLSAVALAKATKFEMKDPFNRNLLRADAEAAIERTTALFTYVEGWLELDPLDLNLGLKGELEIDLRRLDTGVPSKNDFVREKLLTTGEFPTAKITIDKLVAPSSKALQDTVPVTARLTVKVQWRGAAREMMVPVRLTYFKSSDQTKQRLPGNLLRVSSTVDLDLSAFSVSIPEAVRARFPKQVSLLLDLTGSDKMPFDLPHGTY